MTLWLKLNMTEMLWNLKKNIFGAPGAFDPIDSNQAFLAGRVNFV